MDLIRLTNHIVLINNFLSIILFIHEGGLSVDLSNNSKG